VMKGTYPSHGTDVPDAGGRPSHQTNLSVDPVWSSLVLTGVKPSSIRIDHLGHAVDSNPTLLVSTVMVIR
jgi:hypothetical protein